MSPEPRTGMGFALKGLLAAVVAAVAALGLIFGAVGQAQERATSDGRIAVTVEQLRINQRIAQAAIRRANANSLAIERGLRRGSVAVPVVGMASRESVFCRRPACEPRPGHLEGPPHGGGVVVDAQGSLYAPVDLPIGARISGLELVGFDANPPESDVHLTASLYVVRAGVRDALHLATVAMGGGGETYGVARREVQSGARRAVQAGSAYYVEVVFPPASLGPRPVGAAMVRVLLD